MSEIFKDIKTYKSESFQNSLNKCKHLTKFNWCASSFKAEKWSTAHFITDYCKLRIDWYAFVVLKICHIDPKEPNYSVCSSENRKTQNILSPMLYTGQRKTRQQLEFKEEKKAASMCRLFSTPK